MTGRGRLAVCAAVAALAAACALLPLVTPATWLLQVALLVALQTGVGAAARRVPLARPLTIAAQVTVSLLALTVAFVRDEAILGVLPGPEALSRFGALLEQGSTDVGRYAIPAPVTDGIRLLLVGGVLVIALLVDVLAVTYRSAAPAGLPLLALYSVAAGLSEGGARWLWFLCAAGGYLLLLLAEGRERLARWGRVFSERGGPGRTAYEPGGTGPAVAPVRTGRRIGALTLGLALVVPALLPSLGSGLLDSLRGTGGTGPGDGTVSAVNPLVALQDSLNQPENRTVLTYVTDSPAPQEMYLRIVALDRFDGSSWKPSERRITGVPDRLPPPRGLDPGVRTRRVTTEFTAAEWYAQDWLPMPFPASRVSVDGRWRYEPEGRTLVGDDGQTTRGARYRVESLLVEPTAEQLAQAGEPPAALTAEYTRVPDSLPALVQREARRITRAAENDYERAVELQEWFTQEGGFSYDTEVRAGSGSAAIVNFLEQKEGFCVHFAFTMAAMSRTLGIPARVAVGFTPGTQTSGERLAVGLQDAHAWPELYFEGVGWTRFEPTPSRGLTPSYALPESGDLSGEGDSGVPQRPEVPSESLPEPSATEECTVEQKRLDPQCGQALPAPGGGGTGRDGPGPVVLLAVPVGLVAAGVLLLPLLWRVRVRARRLGVPRSAYAAGRGRKTGAGGPGTASSGDPEAAAAEDATEGAAAGTADGAAQGSGAGAGLPGRAGAVTAPEDAEAARRWAQAAWRELLDSGWDYGIVPDESATPRKAAERLVRLGELGPEPAEAVLRVAHAVEQALYAPTVRPVPGLPDDVRRVRAALRDQASRGVRVRALLLPRSSIRVIWAAADRWTAVTHRWRSLLRARPAR
ncbi:transglutaminaseTgpA domain-containing protein [Streptomyces sp. JJ36]|uniref:transglutaminaseTgpA domain-containing protein n=1 Tax=Streptomyces sp. JJ36 TaxID=2736645 RepID=UPI001F3F3FF1|nr:transglutaminaseTgpA domain-containing protein [Streptomyces sp. JJ36]MCF6523016.1 transglutaminase [Streptomyces sp. JJ36]